MTKTISNLSWFEEWMLYFEWLWGRRAVSFEVLRMNYRDLDIKKITKVYDAKLRIVNDCRERFPAFATMNEDESLKSENWMDCYKGKRAIMWDMTDLPIAKPSDAEMQSNTHSSYYGGNVAKGGIALQQCGWIRVSELWQGGITDTDYIVRAGILVMQNHFVETHDVGSRNVKFLNIVDKGFRITSAAWAAGNQTVLQPHFAKSDSKFTGAQTLYSASVASDRGGNERAVRLSKMSGYLSRGLPQHCSVNRFCDSWPAWGFQTNFMYKKVL